jgi:hypothetical protein
MNRINKTFARLHEDAIVKELTKDITNADDLLVAFASVEVTDSVGDVVVIDGINTDEYHAPERGVHLKILGGHLVTAPDGTPPIVGRVERLMKTVVNINGQPTPALVFAMSYAKDGEGHLTQLAKQFKDLFDGGYLDSFSVGLLVKNAERIKETGGLKYNETCLYEISAVSVPANSLANVLRAMDTFGKSFDASRVIIEQLDSVQKALETLAQKVNEDEARNTLGDVVEGLRTAIEGMNKSITEKLDSQEGRLDGIEASLVAKSAPQTPPTGSRKVESLRDVEAIAQTIREFAGR